MPETRKRKRDTVVISHHRESRSSDDSDISINNEQEVFRQYFEAQFEPLPQSTGSSDPGVTTKTTPYLLDDDISDEEQNKVSSDWAGFSEGEDENENENEVKVVEYQSLHPTVDNNEDGDNGIRGAEYRRFMSAKPPGEPIFSASSKVVSSSTNNEKDEESLNLKHDLDLQRLLRESHLLDTQSTKSSLALEGATRHKATEQRMREMGSKVTLSQLQKMPMAHRRGIAAKVVARERKRRMEAVEGGVVLEKKKTTMIGSKQKEKRGKRDGFRGLDQPGMGRFKDGMLKLRASDVRQIQGPMKSGQIKKRGKRRR